MSAKILGLVLEHFPARDAQELAVAAILADAADHDGSHVFPSVARVARLARTSERTVQRALSNFRDSGFLKVKRLGGGRGHPTEYEISVGWLLKKPSVLSELQKGVQQSPIQKKVTDATETPQNPDKRVTKGCHSYGTQPVDPFTRRPTTTGAEVPVPWLEAVEVEIENEEKRRPIMNLDGFRKKVLERYSREGGPGAGVQRQLEARRRVAERPPALDLPKASPEAAARGLAAAKRALAGAPVAR